MFENKKIFLFGLTGNSETNIMEHPTVGLDYLFRLYPEKNMSMHHEMLAFPRHAESETV